MNTETSLQVVHDAGIARAIRDAGTVRNKHGGRQGHGAWKILYLVEQHGTWYVVLTSNRHSTTWVLDDMTYAAVLFTDKVEQEFDE